MMKPTGSDAFSTMASCAVCSRIVATASMRFAVGGRRNGSVMRSAAVASWRAVAGALRRHSEALPLAVTIDAPATLPALPAAVEVAVYRIATEALTNVARHAQAGTAYVELAIDSAVRLSIVDDGTLDGLWIPGIGLTSIRERAAELGGTCTAGPTPTGGRVVAVLPLAVPA